MSLRHLDPSLLMWDMRRNLDPTPMPARRSTIQFLYPELHPSRQNWWLVVEPGVGTDLCGTDPGFEVDLYVETDLRTMTAIWMAGDSRTGGARRPYAVDRRPRPASRNAALARAQRFRAGAEAGGMSGALSFLRPQAPSQGRQGGP